MRRLLISAAALLVSAGAAQAQEVRLQLGSARAAATPITGVDAGGVRVWRGRAPQAEELLGAESPNDYASGRVVKVVIVHRSRLKRLRTQGFYSGHPGTSRRFTQGFWSGPADWRDGC